VEPEDPFGDLALSRRDPQPVLHVDTPDDQHLAVQLDFAGCLGCKASLSRRDPARLQRAPKGPGESAGGRGHNVV
jgi:hypothetical protein